MYRVADGHAARSMLVEAAWAGKLVRLDGLDTLGSTAGAIGRLTQDRECELWEGRRIVRFASDEEVRFSSLYARNPTTHAIESGSE